MSHRWAFTFIDHTGRAAPMAHEATGYFARDYFEHPDPANATAEELAATYRGPDGEGIGVRWTPINADA